MHIIVLWKSSRWMGCKNGKGLTWDSKIVILGLRFNGEARDKVCTVQRTNAKKNENWFFGFSHATVHESCKKYAHSHGETIMYCRATSSKIWFMTIRKWKSESSWSNPLVSSSVHEWLIFVHSCVNSKCWPKRKVHSLHGSFNTFCISCLKNYNIFIVFPLYYMIYRNLSQVISVISSFIIKIIIIIIMSRHQHVYPWPYLPTFLYCLLLPICLLGYFLYRHRAVVCRF